MAPPAQLGLESKSPAVSEVTECGSWLASLLVQVTVSFTVTVTVAGVNEMLGEAPDGREGLREALDQADRANTGSTTW